MNNHQHKIQHLSDLQDGESAIITKVRGYGAFRKRITEMGFVFGTKVKAIKRAPLQDPVEYELMGSRVSLRMSEAKLIEVVPESASEKLEDHYEGTYLSEDLHRTILKKQKTINVALVGNPNSGKTSLFNYATGKQERVGNYSGVTVDLKTAHLSQDGYRINLTDLPGTYSISEFTPEELFVRKHIVEKMPDVVINVVDASNLERNLYLTTQLIDMNIKVVIALNMHDELTKKGDKFDYNLLGKMIGMPIVPTIATKGVGINELMQTVIECYEENDPFSRHIHINYGADINKAIDNIKVEIKKNNIINDKFHSRYVALKLLENDKAFIEELKKIPGSTNILNTAKAEKEKIEKKYNNEPSETIVADAKYAFIRGALKETYIPSPDKKEYNKYKADRWFTHRWLGFPIFFILMYAMFQITFSLGQFPMDWIEAGVGALGKWLEGAMKEGMLRDLLVNGIIGGVGGVIVFLPNILILFFCISLMEDTGYMARAAFIMDKLMHKIGLHGKSFIPLLMGFGCNVPAIMATRTLENRKDRILTMLITPFMSCSARLPIYLLLVSAFFTGYKGLILFSIYLTGILIAILMAILFKKVFFKKEDIPFVMELPPYRMPTIRNTIIHMWNKSVQYLTKMGTVILVASVLIWALGYFPRNADYSIDYDVAIAQIDNNPVIDSIQKKESVQKLEVAKESERMEQSYIGRLGHFITPVINPLGFDWKIGVSIITGLAAKEIIVSTMGVLYQSELGADETSVNLQTKLQQQTFTSGERIGQKVFTPLTAYTFMLFVLIYFPCVAAIAAIKREAGWKWAIFTALYTTLLAWLVAFGVYQIGSLF
ncbi:ferrous iron transport protein B [Bacteroidales bacterium OttesenSCG-928-C19]|nr:ferrous iron transport protein B [Bacteroidales bacterium OttesenSCG-928-C19]